MSILIAIIARKKENSIIKGRVKASISVEWVLLLMKLDLEAGITIAESKTDFCYFFYGYDFQEWKKEGKE